MAKTKGERIMNSTRNEGYFLWKPIERMEKFVKHHIKRNSDTPLKSLEQLK